MVYKTAVIRSWVWKGQVDREKKRIKFVMCLIFTKF